MYTIKHIPEEERPRERLLRHGPEVLSTAELIAVILGSGTKEFPVLLLAQQLITRFGSLQNLADATIAELSQVKGIGPAKAIQLKACFSLGVRAAKQSISNKYSIESPLQAYNLIKDELEGEKRELFVAIFQDTKGQVICHETISIGTLSHTLVHPREVFYPAIRHKAASIIVAHNHPSGDPAPSGEDIELTKVLVEVGKLMKIPVNDHLIVGQGKFVSLRQKGIQF